MKNRTKKILIVILSILIVISGGYLAINLYADSLLNKMNRGEVIKKLIKSLTLCCLAWIQVILHQQAIVNVVMP